MDFSRKLSGTQGNFNIDTTFGKQKALKGFKKVVHTYTHTFLREGGKGSAGMSDVRTE
jgi:hypothetical protein